MQILVLKWHKNQWPFNSDLIFDMISIKTGFLEPIVKIPDKDNHYTKRRNKRN